MAVAVVAAAYTGAAVPAGAHGALAIGSTSNVAKDGVAIGTAVNYDTLDRAKSTAMAYCREYKTARKAAKFCGLVGTFTKECFATAMDPKAGTPGVGWAIATDLKVAQQRAIDACKATAGIARAEFCVLDQSNCDTTP